MRYWSILTLFILSLLPAFAEETGLRQITQTVFNREGKAAARAEVSASYAWNGEWHLLHAAADGAGTVVWKDVPPVRVIVWGPGVPAGVIPADAVTVTAPLPAPQPEKGSFVEFTITNAGPPPVPFRWYLATRGQAQEWIWKNPDGKNPAPKYTLSPYDSQPGTPLSMLIVANTTPLRGVALNGVYLPYAGDQVLHMNLALQEMVSTLTWRFIGSDGKPLHGLSRVKIIPVKLAGNLPQFPLDDPRRDPVLYPTAEEQPDGSYRFTTLYPGTYRLQVDLFDDVTPPLPQFLLEVTPGMHTREIPLPAPLFTVPAGTEVSYLPLHAPAIYRRLVAGAQARAMPVFGPTSALLAAWYPQTPNTLAYYKFSENGKATMTRLPLRSTFLAPKYVDGRAYTGPLHLLPLFPGSRNGYPAYAMSGSHLALRPDEQLISLDRTGGYHADLWPGKYLAVGDVGMMMHPEYRVEGKPDFRAVIDVPATGPAVPVPVVPRPQAARRDRPMTQVVLNFPEANYEAWRKSGARFMVFTFDNDPECSYLVAADIFQNIKYGANQINIPIEAGKLRIRWLGVGAIPEVAIPKADAGKPAMVTLPNWEKGAQLSAQALRAEGTPYANQQLRIVRRLNAMGRAPWLLVDENYVGSHFGPPAEEEVQMTTDARGVFTLNGAPTGDLLVALNTDGQNPEGWIVNMPAVGLGTILQANSRPVQIENWWWGYDRICWWLPDGGQPVLITGRCHNLPTGDGWLWDLSAREAWTTAVRCHLQPGVNQLSIDNGGPALGILFPLDPADPILPGDITLRGQGALAGLNVHINKNDWQPSPMLGLITGQVIAPPGKYQLRVDTPRGPVEAPVTVCEDGAVVRLAFPQGKK